MTSMILRRRDFLKGVAAAGTFTALSGIARAQEAKDVTLRLNYTPNAEHAPYFLGVNKGFYEEAGINLSIQPGTGSADTVKLVGAGNDMFGVAIADAVVIGRGRGVPVQSIGVLLQQSPNIFVSLEQKNIRTPEDLYGKRVGVNGRSTNFGFWKAFAKATELDESKIELIELGTNSTAVSLMGDVIDAGIILATNEQVVLERDGVKLNVIDMAQYGLRSYGQCLFTNEQLASIDPDIVKRMREATLRSWQYSAENIDEAVAILKENVPEVDPQAETAKWHNIVPRMKSLDGDVTFGEQSVEGWTSTYETFALAGLIDTPYEPASLIADVR